MTITSPGISVLMPVFNAEPYLAEAIESILNQTLDNFEFIIINDGSTDRSLQILEKYEQLDSRIRLVSRENRGLVKTLNEGLSLANASLIARMDADDVAYPNRFFAQKEFLDRNPSHLLIGSRVLIIDDEGDPICEMGSHFTHEDIVQGLLSRQGQLIYHPSIMFRKNDVLKIGGYRDKYPHVEDLDLFLRLAKNGKIENLNSILLKYREHFQKVGHIHNAQQEKEIDLLLAEAHNERNSIYSKPSNLRNHQNITIQERLMTWAWLALKAKNIATAKKYAIKCLMKSPFSLDVWRLLACVLRGH